MIDFLWDLTVMTVRFKLKGLKDGQYELKDEGGSVVGKVWWAKGEETVAVQFSPSGSWPTEEEEGRSIQHATAAVRQGEWVGELRGV